MNLIVDTSVWSLFLRRKHQDPDNIFVKKLRNHLEQHDEIHMVGLILQELLDGIKVPKHFNVLVKYFKPFPIIKQTREDYIEAARLKNKCRSRGITAGTVDFLITSVCIQRNYPLLTSDNDFNHIALHSDLMLL